MTFSTSTPDSHRRGTLTVVGTGIRLINDTTFQAIDEIRRAECVLHLAGDAASQVWLQQLNPANEALGDCYAEGRPRELTYRMMTGRILERVRSGRRVVAAFYGHPGVGVYSAHAAVRQALAEGFQARMLPGISAEACLVADLGVDPMALGWQSHEAWTFLARRPSFDPQSALVLWQLGFVYEQSVNLSGQPNMRGIKDVAEHLETVYAATHEVILYEASPFSICKARIDRMPLAALRHAKVTPATTLYIPPVLSTG